MQFVLKEWSADLAPSLAETADDLRIAKWLRDVFPHPYAREDADAFIAFASAENARGEWYRAIVAEGRAVGGVAVTRGQDVAKRSGELGYWLAPAYWGKGVMTEAVGRLCVQVFAESDLVRIFAEPFADNAASCRVLEKCGFSLEGTLRKSVWKSGAFHDARLYALIKE